MASQETIRSKQYYRVYTGRVGDVDKFDRLSFWSSASDCELANKLDVNTVIGNALGFTSSLTSNGGYLADIQAVKDLSDELKNDYLDGIKLKKLSLNEYNKLAIKDDNTLYIIV